MPSVVATIITIVPTNRLLASAPVQSGLVKKSRYHCSDQPGSGKTSSWPDVKDSGTTTKIGATR